MYDAVYWITIIIGYLAFITLIVYIIIAFVYYFKIKNIMNGEGTAEKFTVNKRKKKYNRARRARM